jgi:SAM-dependent methyltransferase
MMMRRANRKAGCNNPESQCGTHDRHDAGTCALLERTGSGYHHQYPGEIHRLHRARGAGGEGVRDYTGLTIMAEIPHSFVDSVGYERLMGRWSRVVGAVFLEWLAPPSSASWLEIGCGTGIFTELILGTCSPASLAAIDPAPAQIDHANRQPVAQRTKFRVADAQALPFPNCARRSESVLNQPV